MTGPRDPDESLDLFTFAVGPHTYAVDVQRVDEVLPPLEVAARSRSDALVEGSVMLRGESVPVVDLRRCLPQGEPPVPVQPRMLVCWLGRRRVAFRVDRVGAVVRVGAASLGVPPPTGELPPAVVAVSSASAGTQFLLDLRELLRQQSPSAPAPE
jgi:purine-binding chemotaxis protein CheW